MKRKEKKIAPFKALYWIISSIFLVTGSAATLLFFYLRWQKERRLDPNLHISMIIQTGPQKNALPSEYLAEVMGLSRDRPAQLYQFDVKQAEGALLSSPLIKSAHVKVVQPNAIYVDYAVRKPIAWLFDYENIAVDDEGYLFPVYPFFSPKQLPELYLGLVPFGTKGEVGEKGPGEWNVPLKGKYIELGLDLLQKSCNLNVKRIDVANAYAPTLGNREIVLTLEDEVLTKEKETEHLCLYPRLIRLSTKNYTKELSNFLELRKTLLDNEKKELYIPDDSPFIYSFPQQVIDLRVDGLGFIKPAEKHG